MSASFVQLDAKNLRNAAMNIAKEVKEAINNKWRKKKR